MYTDYLLTGYPGFPLLCTVSAPSPSFQFLPREFCKPNCEAIPGDWNVGMALEETGEWTIIHHFSPSLASSALLLPSAPQQNQLPSASPPLGLHLYPEQPPSCLHHFLNTCPAAARDLTLATTLFSPFSTLESFSVLPQP